MTIFLATKSYLSYRNIKKSLNIPKG